MSTAVSSDGRDSGRAASPWLLLFSSVLMVLGVGLLALYFVYLPMPHWFQSEIALQQAGVSDPGMIFYCLATAGSAFVVWGRLMGCLRGDVINRSALMKAAALGMLLLGVMRLGTALFPHGAFQQMVALPVTEFNLFSFIAWRLYKSA